MAEPAATSQAPGLAQDVHEHDPQPADSRVPFGTPPASPSPLGDANDAPFTNPDSGSKWRRPGRPAIHHGCQMCGASLEGMRVFHQRYHICELHMQAEEVLWKGIPQRFCQQCGRFHELPEFEQGMRSCKKQLARHAERRRQGRERAAAARAAARAAQATGGAAPVPALAGSSRDTEGTDSLPMAAPTATAETVSLRAADLQGVALAIAKPEQEQEQEAVQRQQEEQQAAESFEQPAGGAGRSGSGASTVLQLPAASQSAGGLSAFLSAAAAEEAAEAAAAEEETDGTEGRRQRRRKQPRLAVEPDVTWFAPQLPVPPALTASPPISGLLGVDAASALNTTTLEQLSGIVWPTQARAAAAAAGLPGGLPQAPLASTLAALLQGAVPVVAPTPPLGLQQLLLPQHAAVLSLLLLQQQQQQQQQQRLDAFALLQQQQQQQQQRLDAFALLQQQELLRNLRTLVAPRPAVPTPPLPLQAVQQSAALDQQREQHVAVLFQAAVESLLGGLLGRPPGFP